MTGNLSIAAADSNTSIVEGIVLSHVSRLGPVTVTHHGRVGAITLNSAAGPDMAIQGAVTIGNNLMSADFAARAIGSIVVNNAKSIAGDLVIATRAAVSAAGTLGSVAFASRATAPLVVDGVVSIVSHTQETTRSVEFVNFKSAGLLTDTTFASIYKLGTVLGPVTFNGKAINAALTPAAAYNLATLANDPDCINKCKGRGSAQAATTSCVALAVRSHATTHASFIG